MGKRCQVCDGPIINGRCKYCGMPYRNDMELYHLNEDRSEHYRHASAKVRKAMVESEIPLPDRNKTVKKPGKTAAAQSGKMSVGTQTARTQKTAAKKITGQSYNTRTVRTYQTDRKAIQGQKKKDRKASKILWIFVLVLMVAAGQAVEHWDTIGYRIEDFVKDEFGIDLGSFFGDSSTDEINESDWDETADVADSDPSGMEDNPYYYIFNDEEYIIGENYLVTEKGDTDNEDVEYEFMIDPGEYMLESGWGAKMVLEIKCSSGKVETVKFDEAGHQESVKLHTGDEVSAVSPDGQDNYLAMYQIQQYDE